MTKSLFLYYLLDHWVVVSESSGYVLELFRKTLRYFPRKMDSLCFQYVSVAHTIFGMRDKTADFRDKTADSENGTKSPISIMRQNRRF